MSGRALALAGAFACRLRGLDVAQGVLVGQDSSSDLFWRLPLAHSAYLPVMGCPPIVNTAWPRCLAVPASDSEWSSYLGVRPSHKPLYGVSGAALGGTPGRYRSGHDVSGRE